MHTLQKQIDGIEKELAQHCRNTPGYALLKSVVGIGDVLATVILLETGSIERFADVGNYASYCRCVGSAHMSNGKKKGEGNTKNGNRYLAWAYVISLYTSPATEPSAIENRSLSITYPQPL
jgi:transposase